jgi:hypothetical protein
MAGDRNAIGTRTGTGTLAMDRVKVMRVQSGHWLDYDPVALLVLIVGIGAVALLALSI